MSRQMRIRCTRPCLLPGLALLTLAACGRPDRGTSERDTTAAGTPATSPTDSAVPNRVATITGFRRPESARYYSPGDVYFVSNIDGNPAAKDGNGFISRVSADGAIDSLRFVAGGRGGARLDAPKGTALVGDTLWVADIDQVRGFNARTGAPVATVDLSAQGALFLNDIAVGPDRSLYITDTGLRGGQHTGPDRIFRIAPDRTASVALRSDSLGGPNGIAWDGASERFVVVPFAGPRTLLAWKPGSTTLTAIGTGAGQFDGVEVLGDGRLLVTSWADSSLTIRAGDSVRRVGGLPSPADIGVDTRRQRVAVPLLRENRVEIWTIPPAR